MDEPMFCIAFLFHKSNWQKKYSWKTLVLVVKGIILPEVCTQLKAGNKILNCHFLLISTLISFLTSFLSVLVSYIKVIFYFQSEPLKGKVERILHWRYVNLPIEGTTL